MCANHLVEQFSAYITPDHKDVITLDPQVEKIILDSVQRTEAGSYMTMEPAVSNKIINKVSSLCEKLVKMGNSPLF